MNLFQSNDKKSSTTKGTPSLPSRVEQATFRKVIKIIYNFNYKRFWGEQKRLLIISWFLDIKYIDIISSLHYSSSFLSRTKKLRLPFGKKKHIKSVNLRLIYLSIFRFPPCECERRSFTSYRNHPSTERNRHPFFFASAALAILKKYLSLGGLIIPMTMYCERFCLV